MNVLNLKHVFINFVYTKLEFCVWHILLCTRQTRYHACGALVKIKWLRLRSCVFFVTWLRLSSGCALLIHFSNFAIPSVLLVANERVIPTHFELISNTATTTRPA